jgi:demethylmenaquinone methyltransferase/2-methoxy-6-polyprenyl-1,4-benzoquinol methylase
MPLMRSFGAAKSAATSAIRSRSSTSGTRPAYARALFAPLGGTYDRYARLLSFGQDPRWRAFLVSRVPDSAQRVLDVATGTAAVAIELARASPSRTVVGIDQSSEMLAAGRTRVASARLADRIELREGNAEALPFADGEFDALTFTYLLRYVDDPLATLRELARVVRPGGTLAMLEFGVPHGVWRPPWELYVRVGLPAAGAVISPGWREVGRFLGPSIREFHGRYSLTALWREAGLTDVAERRLSLGGGVVVWATR